MDAISTHSTFWRPVKIGLAVIAGLVLCYWLVNPGPHYEPPINGQYNSPANTDYERAYEEQGSGAYDEPNDGKTDAERLGEQVGNGWNGVRDAGKDFWDGVQSTAK